MKLLTFDTGTGPRAGVLSGDTVLDAASLLGESRPLRDVQALLELPNDPATSLGPYVVTPDELTIRDGKLFANCVLKVNGQKWMENNASIAHHSWGAMIERASRDSRIAPGDVLGSGTVSGGTIGEAMR